MAEELPGMNRSAQDQDKTAPRPQGASTAARSEQPSAQASDPELFGNHAGPASVPPPLHRILEALLFVGGAPLSPARAAEAVRGLTPAQFFAAVETLNRDYRAQGRPYRVRPREQGFELTLQPTFRGVQERLHGSTREARLSPVALDVLALVAYRQPALKAEIDAVRGADSAAALRQLVRLGLVAVQRGQADQQEVSYSTTRRFLSLFDLGSLDDLPRTQDPERM
jgi:segregation and condensation protein B